MQNYANATCTKMIIQDLFVQSKNTYHNDYASTTERTDTEVAL